MNNPLKYFDPNGCDYLTSTLVDEIGTVVDAKNDSDNNIYVEHNQDEVDEYETGGGGSYHLDVVGHTTNPAAFVGHNGVNILSNEGLEIIGRTGGGDITVIKNGEATKIYIIHSGGDEKTLERLSNAVGVADLGISITEEGGYKATVGIWRNLLKYRYYSSGWSGSNQYVWQTFGVAESLGYIFYAGGIISEISLYLIGGQPGLETSLNIGVGTTSFIVGGAPGIAISCGYDYGKFMWNSIVGFGNSLNRLYNETMQNYLKGSPYDMSGQP